MGVSREMVCWYRSLPRNNKRTGGLSTCWEWDFLNVVICVVVHDLGKGPGSALVYAGHLVANRLGAEGGGEVPRRLPRRWVVVVKVTGRGVLRLGPLSCLDGALDIVFLERRDIVFEFIVTVGHVVLFFVSFSGEK